MSTKYIVWALFIGLFAIGFQSCKEEEEVGTDAFSDTGVQLDDTPYNLAIGRFEEPTIAPDNPLTVQGVRLGRMLFYEKKLSKNGNISCASCHKQENAFTDTNRFSAGTRGLFGHRQAMSVFNMAWNSTFFWDGRAQTLRDQSLLPIQDALEMEETLGNVVAKLENSQDYKDQFTRAFGTAEITPTKMSLAMEQFMNSIVSVDSKYDRFLNGSASLDSNEERGRVLFFAEYNPSFPSLSGADCQHCHSGDNFDNKRFMNNALDTDAEMQDDGRMDVTARSSDKGKFKVTSLRNIALTPPYMHDGRFNTLEEVVEHYNSGMKNSSTVDPALLYPLNNGGLLLSSEDKRDLVAFLKTLTDKVLLTDPQYSDPF
jgi:cytochrome c peroxidase